MDSLIFFSPFFFFAPFLTLYQPTILGPFSSLSQTLAVFLETLFLGSLLFTKILFSPVPRTLTLIIFCHFEDDTHYLYIHFLYNFLSQTSKKALISASYYKTDNQNSQVCFPVSLWTVWEVPLNFDCIFELPAKVLIKMPMLAEQANWVPISGGVT